MGIGGVLARAAAFIFGVVGSAIIVHAFGYRVVDLPPPEDTATIARQQTELNPQRHNQQIFKALQRHAQAADWSRR